MNKKIIVIGIILIGLFGFLTYKLMLPPQETFEKKTIKIPDFSQQETEIKVQEPPKNYTETNLGNGKRKFSLKKPEDNLTINIYNPYPTLELLKWNDTRLSISLMEVYPEEPELIIDGNKIIYSNSWFDEVFYELPEGYEYEVILKVKPNKDYITFDLNLENLDVFYQLPLNEETPENVMNLDCNATNCWDSNGTIKIWRPKKIVGSYAIYHSTKKNNEYKAGKAFHIYKPHVIDSEGWEEYCEIEINEQQEELTITCPRKYIRDAIYPITIDPTFGNVDTGGSQTIISNYIVGAKVTMAAENGTLDSIEVHGEWESSPGGDLHAAIYTDNSGEPDALGDESDTPVNVNSFINQWWEVTMPDSYSLTASTDYWLAYIGEDFRMQYDGTGGTARYKASQAGFEDPFVSSPSSASWYVSVFGNYTAGGGETSCDEHGIDTNWFISDECFFIDQNINLGTGLLSIDCGGVLGLDNALVTSSYPYFNIQYCVSENNPVRRKNGGDVILTPN